LKCFDALVDRAANKAAFLAGMGGQRKRPAGVASKQCSKVTKVTSEQYPTAAKVTSEQCSKATKVGVAALPRSTQTTSELPSQHPAGSAVEAASQALLVDMGFAPHDATRALQAASGDIDRAVGQLLLDVTSSDHGEAAVANEVTAANVKHMDPPKDDCGVQTKQRHKQQSLHSFFTPRTQQAGSKQSRSN